MADTKVTQAALDEAEGVTSTAQIAEDVATTDDIVQADGDFLFLKMGGMVAVSQATIAALKSGSVGASAASTSTAGTVKQAAKVSDSTATDVATLVADYNKLLASLRAAGILAS